MNKFLKLSIFLFIGISLIIAIVLTLNRGNQSNISNVSNVSNVSNLSNVSNESNLSNVSNESNVSTLNDKYNYLVMEENDFNKLSIQDRWIYRSKCLNVFNFIKDNYSLKNYIYPLPNIRNTNNKIFINLASYRDPECSKTIKSLIYNSSNWNNLRIVVCQQNAEEDKDCKIGLEEKYLSNVEVIILSYKDARGPTWARFLIQQKYNGEKYYMQIDSHTIFEKDWDSKLIQTLNELPPKSCLTQYLPDYNIGEFKTTPKLRKNLVVSRICSLDGFSRINSEHVNLNENFTFTEPFKSNCWSGCFSFSRGDICIDAPIDCYTPDVFFGEEMDITLRLFTRGWNFYSPHYPIAYTSFYRGYRDTFWKKKGLGYDKNITLCSRLRIHYRLGTLPNYLKQKLELECPELLIQHERFKLGNQKTLKDYENLIGFNFNNEKSI
jgi:hypothetical protein